MGKAGGSKQKRNIKSSNPVSSYFPKDGPLKEQDLNESNMTSPRPTGESPASPICKQDLIDLKAELKAELQLAFKSSMAELLQPVQQTLDELSEGLGSAFKAAETAVETAEAVQAELKDIKNNEQTLRSKVLFMENKWRQMNLKFRGFEEGVEKSSGSDLAIFLANWLAKSFHLEDGVAPTIVRAHRIGPIATARQNRPRDILAQFLYAREKDKILKEARNSQALTFNGRKIIILLDLPAEILEKRRLLKPFSSKLFSTNIRFRWTPNSSIAVYREGKLLQASDLHSGLALMEFLNIQMTKEEVLEIKAHPNYKNPKDENF